MKKCIEEFGFSEYPQEKQETYTKGRTGETDDFGVK